MILNSIGIALTAFVTSVSFKPAPDLKGKSFCLFEVTVTYDQTDNLVTHYRCDGGDEVVLEKKKIIGNENDFFAAEVSRMATAYAPSFLKEGFEGLSTCRLIAPVSGVRYFPRYSCSFYKG